MTTAESNYRLLLFFLSLPGGLKSVDYAVPYTNYVVKSHKVQSVKITPHK